MIWRGKRDKLNQWGNYRLSEEQRSLGIATVSKFEIFLTVIKLLIVAVPFSISLVARWVEAKCLAARSRLLRLLWPQRPRKKRG